MRLLPICCLFTLVAFAAAGDEGDVAQEIGRILLDLSKAGGDLADRILTTAPDVTVSTNLGAWVNQRGLFRRKDMADVFAAARIQTLAVS